MARIAVLGSNSFSGSDFIALLLEQGQHDVLGISRAAEKGPLFLPYLARDRSRFRFVQADLNRDMPALLAALDAFRPEWIVNFAAQSEVGPSWHNPDHWFETNTVALARLINHLKGCDYLERYLHVSSPEVYGTCVGTVYEDAPLNPSTPYAASKAAADLLLFTYFKNQGLPLFMVRATNVYGPHQQLFKIIPRSAIYLRQERKISLHGGGVAVKSYIHIRDVSRGELRILEAGRPGEIYHLSPDRGYAVREIVRKLCDLARVSFDTAVESAPERLGQDAAYVINSDKARTELRWRPTISIDDGLAQVDAWVQTNWAAFQNEPLDYTHRP